MKSAKSVLVFFIIYWIYTALHPLPLNGQSKNKGLTIDLIPAGLFSDHNLHGGGGCQYTETKTGYDSANFILVTQMNDSVREALVCINKHGYVMKFDSVNYTKHNRFDTTFEVYSNAHYSLTIISHLKWDEEGNLEGDDTGMMIIKSKTGKHVTKNIYGICGAY